MKNVKQKKSLRIYFSAIALSLFCSLPLFAELGRTFTATLPSSKPGDAAGNFDLVLSGLCGKGSGTFSDTKTGHYKYVVNSGSTNGETCAGDTSWWTTKRASEVSAAGSFTRYGLQLNTLQVLQSFNSKVQNSILNGKNNTAEDAYVCPSGAGGSSADYNWILLRPRTPEDVFTIKKNYANAAQNRVGGRMHYTQSGGSVTFTGEGSFDIVNLTEASTAYAIGPLATCSTSSSASQQTTNTGADYLDPYGNMWFGKLDGSGNPQIAAYVSTKSSPLVALIAPTQVLDNTIMQGLKNYRFAALYSSWNSRTAISTKTALITPNNAGTSFAITEITNLDTPNSSSTSLGTITCTNWNSPSDGFCTGTLTLTGSAATGNSVCMIANVGNQTAISCIAQNPADPSYAITLLSTYSKKANITVTPSYSEGVGCKNFAVENLSNRYIPNIGIPSNGGDQLSGNWSLHADSFSGTGGYCSTTLAPWTSCNIKVCNSDATAAAETTTVRIAYEEVTGSTVNATTTATKIPTVIGTSFSSPSGTTITCTDAESTIHLANKFQFNLDYGSGNVEDIIASVDSAAYLNLTLSTSSGYSIISNKLYVDCSVVHDGDQVTVSAKYYGDGDLTDTDGSVTVTVSVQIPCDAGYYCPAGSVNSHGAPSGGLCPAGLYCEAETTSILGTGSCAAGRYCPAGSTTNQGAGPCAAGYYCEAGSTTNHGTGLCSIGRYCEEGSATSMGTGACAAGYYCEAGSATSQGTGACPAGRYCSGGASSTLGNGACAAGRYCLEGSTDNQGQGICAAGYYCEAGSGTSHGTGLCPAGKYCEAGATSTSGTGDCAAGYYCLAGSTENNPINGWVATSTTGAPGIRNLQTALWTGSKMLVWGGYSPINTGGQFDPVTDSWSATTTTGAPIPRYFHQAAWTGSKMLIWGGYNLSVYLNSGGQYDPAANSWTAMTTTGAPLLSSNGVSVWTSTKLLVFGGANGGGHLNTGGQYDPSANSWTEMTTTGAPAVRTYATAEWTGSKMLVWGGTNNGTSLNTGGLYDPSANSWIIITTTGAPSIRTYHSSVWSGSKMIVWGGSIPIPMFVSIRVASTILQQIPGLRPQPQLLPNHVNIFLQFGLVLKCLCGVG